MAGETNKEPGAFSVVVKGIVFQGGEVLLRKNERNEWDLPGGALQSGEQPEDAVSRELQEELGFEAKVLRIVHAHHYSAPSSGSGSRGVMMITYLCKILGAKGTFRQREKGGGNAELKSFPLEDIFSLTMPQFCKDAILQGVALYSTVDEYGAKDLHERSGYALAES